MLCKVRDHDLGEREIRYHNCCHREYTRSSRKHTANKDSESTQSQAAHNDAFQFIRGYILEHILIEGEVERLSMIRERYLSFILEKHPRFYNEKYDIN